MAVNIFGLYNDMYANMQRLQDEEKALSARSVAARRSANEETEKAKAVTDSVVAGIDEQIAQLEIYIESALNHGAARGYIPTPALADPMSLQQLYTMLSESNESCVEAEKLYCMALDAKAYYTGERKRKEQELIQKENHIADSLNNTEAVELRKEADRINKEYIELATGKNAVVLVKEIRRRTELFNVKSGGLYRLSPCTETTDIFCLGYVFEPFPIKDEYTPYLSSTFGSYYRENEHALLLPLSIRSDGKRRDGSYAAPIITVEYGEKKAGFVSRIITGILFNILRNYVPLNHRVYCIDLDSFNPEQIGVMRMFTGSDGMIVYPTSPQAALSAINGIESKALSENKDQRSRRYLIIRGLRKTSLTEADSIVKRICYNASLYNICVIMIDRASDDGDRDLLTGKQPSLAVTESNGDFYTSVNGGNKVRFAFHSAPGGILPESCEALLKGFAPLAFDNRYEKYFSLDSLPAYVTSPRKREKISLPYGVVESDRSVTVISLEKMGFATFLMGGSGSGKTSLIHSLIASVVGNYHPDEVELWLADFKQAGFAPYNTEHIPPHIKYILMDTSYEMIYDFIDRMVKELSDRESRLSLMMLEDRIATPVNCYMPAIIVIIDEFSAVSEAVLQNDSYRYKLDRLLSKGRSNGFKFIFASQAFTTGAAALSPFAKVQISSRMAMKNVSIDEIKATLNIPNSQMTDSINFMIDTLPPYYTLYKEEENDGTCTVTRSKVLYFENNDNDGFKRRYAQYDRIKSAMVPVEESQLDADHPEMYVNKHPVAIHSDILLKFDKDTFIKDVERFRSDNNYALTDEDTVVSFGQARRLNPDSYAFITKSRRENIFLLSNKDEYACTMSILYTTALSYMGQHKLVSFWCHERSPLYNSYKKTAFSVLPVTEGAKAVCGEIDAVIDLINKKQSIDRLIVLVGLERIINELEEADNDKIFGQTGFSADSVLLTGLSPKKYSDVPIKKYMASTSEEESMGRRDDEIMIISDKLEEEFKRELRARGKSAEEIDIELTKNEYVFIHKAEKIYNLEHGLEDSEQIESSLESLPQTETQQSDESEQPAEVKKSDESKQPAKEKSPGQYAADLLELIRNGSRYGCHFLLVLNDYNQLKDLSLKIDSFNHRLTFRTDTADTSQMVVNTTRANKLAPHVCLYAAQGSSSETYLLTPYLYKGLSWN